MRSPIHIPAPLRRLLVPGLAATMALAAAGCGSSHPAGVTAAAYTRSLCSTVTPFETDVVRRAAALDVSPATTPLQRKQAFESFLSAVAGDAPPTINKLKAAGTPRVKNGKSIATAVVRAFSQLQAATQRALARAKTLPTTSTAAYETGLHSIQSDFQNSLGAIGSTLRSTAGQSPALQKAAARQPACMTLSRQG